MSEVVDILTKQIIGFPGGDYLKAWDYQNGVKVYISSNKRKKRLSIGINGEYIGMIEREQAQLFVDMLIKGGVFKVN